MGNGGTLIRSTDGGDSWSAQTLEQFQDLYSASIDPSGFGLLTGEARVYRTTDHGATWAPVQIGSYHSKLNKVSFGTDQLGASAGWLTMGGLENGVVRTTDGGRHWTNVTGGNAQWLGVHLRPNGVGWIGGGQGVNRSTTDFFATTTNHPGPEVAVRCTWALSASTAIMGGGYINGGCYRTTNGGTSWQQVLNGGNIFDLWFINDTLGFCGGAGGSIARTTDAGATWTWIDTPSNSDINSIFFLNDTLGFFAGNGGARTTDGGDTWTLIPELPQFTMSIFFTDPDTGYAVQYSGYVLRSTDGGDSWDELVPAPFDVGMNDATLVDGALLAVGDHGDVFRAALQCPTTPHIPTVLQSGSTLCTAYRPQIQWYLNGEPLPDATGPCITATEPGSYTVRGHRCAGLHQRSLGPGAGHHHRGGGGRRSLLHPLPQPHRAAHHPPLRHRWPAPAAALRCPRPPAAHRADAGHAGRSGPAHTACRAVCAAGSGTWNGAAGGEGVSSQGRMTVNRALPTEAPRSTRNPARRR